MAEKSISQYPTVSSLQSTDLVLIQRGDEYKSIALSDFIKGTSGAYVYYAQISQSGTNAPTADVVFFNNIPTTVTYYYDNVGEFRIGSTSFQELTDNKVFVIVGPSNQNDDSKQLDAYVTTAPIGRDPLTVDCEIALETVNGTSKANGLIFKSNIMILVLP